MDAGGLGGTVDFGTATCVSSGPCTPSDNRIKTGVVNANTTTSLEKIMSLAVKNYNYTSDWETFSNKTINNGTIGLIAQDVLTVIPEAVRVNGNFTSTKSGITLSFTDFLTLDKDVVFMHLTAAFQELKLDYDSKIAAFEARIYALENP